MQEVKSRAGGSGAGFFLKPTDGGGLALGSRAGAPAVVPQDAPGSAHQSRRPQQHGLDLSCAHPYPGSELEV